MNRKNRWERFFRKKGLNLSAGIRATIEEEIRKSLSPSQEDQVSHNSEKIYHLTETIDKFERILNEKFEKINNLEYQFPAQSEVTNYEKLKDQIIEKLKVYGPLGTIQISDLMDVPGPDLLPVLRRLKNEKNPKITLNKEFEWYLL